MKNKIKTENLIKSVLSSMVTDEDSTIDDSMVDEVEETPTDITDEGYNFTNISVNDSDGKKTISINISKDVDPESPINIDELKNKIMDFIENKETEIDNIVESNIIKATDEIVDPISEDTTNVDASLSSNVEELEGEEIESDDLEIKEECPKMKKIKDHLVEDQDEFNEMIDALESVVSDLDEDKQVAINKVIDMLKEANESDSELHEELENSDEKDEKIEEDEVILNSLILDPKYRSVLNSVVELGIMTKEYILSEYNEDLFKESVSEYMKEYKAIEASIALKKNEREKATKLFIENRKRKKDLVNKFTLLSNSIETLKNSILNKKLTHTEAKSIISSILENINNSNKLNALLANNMNNMLKAIGKNKINKKDNDIVLSSKASQGMNNVCGTLNNISRHEHNDMIDDILRLSKN